MSRIEPHAPSGAPPRFHGPSALSAGQLIEVLRAPKRKCFKVIRISIA